jgi:hypothetical protein
MNQRASSSKRKAPHSSAGTKATTGAPTPDHLDPSKIRVVDLKPKGRGGLIRRDCYDPDGAGAKMGDVLGLKGGQLWLRVVDWARSKSMDAEVEIKWEATGLTREEIDQVEVFTWPVGEPVEVFLSEQ